MPIVLPEVDPCPFCEIAGEGDHWSKWAEDDLTLTILNGRQLEEGQSLVIPRRHAPTLFDLTAEESAAIMRAAERAARALAATFDPDGILLYQNNGVGSLQEVPHFHLHVVPRQPGSDWGPGPPHLALQEQRANNSRFDYTQDTDEKRQTVRLLALQQEKE